MKCAEVQHCNCLALRRAARRISQQYDAALSPAGLRATQFAMLAVLSGSGGMSIQDLAAKLELDRTTTGKNLRPLERELLVQLDISAADRRSRMVSLTVKGSKRLLAAYPLWRGVQQQFEADNGRRRSKALRDELAGLHMA